MTLYDISLPLSAQLPTWPDDPPVSVYQTASLAKGDACTVSAIHVGAHTGTHIDAPGHYLTDGKMVESIPLDILIGRCLVIEVSCEHLIERADLRGYDLAAYSKILLKTNNSDWWAKQEKAFHPDYVALGISAAEYLAESHVELIGIDYLSIEQYHAPGNPVHRLLLSNNIAILEGLNLAGIRPGEYELLCLPLKLEGCEGAPVRAVLREGSGTYYGRSTK